MKEATKIINHEGKSLDFKKYIPVKKAALLSREHGFAGRLQIQHTIKTKKDEITHSFYTINEQNKVISAIFPYQNLFVQSLLYNRIPSKTKQ